MRRASDWSADTILSCDWSVAWVWSMVISLTPGQDGSLTTKPITATQVSLGVDCHQIILMFCVSCFYIRHMCLDILGIFNLPLDIKCEQVNLCSKMYI